MSIYQLLVDTQRNRKIISLLKEEIYNTNRYRNDPYFEINKQEC